MVVIRTRYVLVLFPLFRILQNDACDARIDVEISELRVRR